MDGRVNISESLINVVTANKPKVLIGLNQKVRGQGQVLIDHLSQMSSHRRRGGTYPIRVYMWNVVSPYFSLWESEPQGEPIEMRVEEDGKSECRPVVGRIGVALRPHHPMRKQADFHLVSRHKRVW